MKRLLISCLLFIVICSCGPSKQEMAQMEGRIPPLTVTSETPYSPLCINRYGDEVNYRIDLWEVRVVVIDSCEYLAYYGTRSNEWSITHKGNCKFCRERALEHKHLKDSI